MKDDQQYPAHRRTFATHSVNLGDAWRNWPVELQWRVQARIGEQRLAVVAPFRYEPPVAMLEAVGEPLIEEEFLVMPLEIDTERPGYYFVQANLYSSAGQPLLHLQAEGPVAPSYPALELRAFGPALKELQAPGPYQLMDVQLVRMSDEETADLNGRARLERYRVEGFPLSAYPESSWSDPLAQQRLEFLNALGAED